MITLERIRLVNWHNFKDDVIEIGNRCLLAGDNGSGKSTVIDALQYVMAANLRMAKFNSAAEERKGGGRDLMGYVRCKLGSEATEYRRGDTIAHVMLEWQGPEPNMGFACGVCIEAWKDNHYNEHFWTGTDISIKEIMVHSENNEPSSHSEPLVFRQFKNSVESVNEQKVIFFESKETYTRDITNKLGVFRRHQKVNSYLDTLTRSIGFKPLASIDQFVCDYVLDENPVSIQDMKQNLENYKEADRQARGAIAKIASLKKICAKAAEWKNYDGLILKQEYLKLKIELENEKQEREAISRKHTKTQNHFDSTERRIVLLNQKLFDTERELIAVVQSLAANDAHRLFEEIRGRIERIRINIDREKENANRYREIKSQCETLLNRKLGENFDEENVALVEEAGKYHDEKYAARQKKEFAVEQLQDTRSELADLERGILRYPDAPRELMAALQKAGIEAHILAEAAEITDPTWADAVEGWLNTRRFAVLVTPADFQKALEVYDRLPRSVAGAFLPNIEKMRNAAARQGSLAETVKADGYARIYINYALGKVMRADVASLKEYDSAVTKECMTYMNHTASRIKEEVYRRRYLGRAAQEERRKFLINEKDRLELDLAAAEREERQAEEHEDCCDRVIRFLPKLENLFPSVENSEVLDKDLAQAETELAAIDTKSFIELEERRKEIDKQLSLLKEDNNRLQNEKGDLQRTLLMCADDLAISSRRQEEKEDRVKNFGNDYPLIIGECEEYAEEKLSKTSIEELTNSYESTLKNFKTRTETYKKEYNKLVGDYDREFHYLLGMDPADNAEAETLLKRLETSELPEYREKIARAYQDAEKEFKDHFISRLNEHIEEARESFNEINDILRTLHFGRDQYRFHLEELNERKGQIEVIRNAAKIPVADDGLFSQIADPGEKKAAQDLFDSILNAPLDSEELKRICDYRTYFHYDIIITETDALDDKGNQVKLSLSRVLKEKSGGESQTPYYVAIAASFYRFFKARPESTVRLVIFDEAFYRMDDERIGKILAFYKELNLQIVTSVPPEKIEAIAPYMDRINVISRFGDAVKVRDCHIDADDLGDIEIGTA
ncbi:MAG: hypothetical protein LBI06_01465 [Treponema sp.]|jgi:energy-coupling factor transporter ATP-binding protein EcfA2|nr:hypothetical protein [Treponema sp.]